MTTTRAYNMPTQQGIEPISFKVDSHNWVYYNGKRYHSVERAWMNTYVDIWFRDDLKTILNTEGDTAYALFNSLVDDLETMFRKIA